MEVILKEDILVLGYKDDVVNVKKGYARNYLIPQGKAIIATESAKKVLAENQRQRAHKFAQIKADAQAIADKMAPFGYAITPTDLGSKLNAAQRVGDIWHGAADPRGPGTSAVDGAPPQG